MKEKEALEFAIGELEILAGVKYDFEPELPIDQAIQVLKAMVAKLS